MCFYVSSAYMLKKIIRQLVEELRTIIQDLNRGKFPQENHHLRDSRESQGSTDRFPLKIPPALPQLDLDDYPNACFWTAQQWQQFLNNQMDYGNSHGKLGFICDEDGNPVSKERIKKMTETAKKLWSDLFRHRYDPETWRCVAMCADEYYTTTYGSQHVLIIMVTNI